MKLRFTYIVLLAMLVMACSSTDGVSGHKGDDNQSSQFSQYDYVVSKDSTGDFSKLQNAIDAVEDYQTKRTYIYIKNGTYKELITVPAEKTYITLVGESKDNVILTYDNAANKTDPETGEKYGTSGSSSVYIHAQGFAAKNITFQNSAGYYNGRRGKTEYGQTLAIYIDGDQSVFDNCKFLSGQDTFYADQVRSYIKDSYIEGTTDFIFGPATAVFENCEIHSYGGTAITAANTRSFVNYGLVFQNCDVTAEEGVKTTLGRPWQEYPSAVAFLNSNLSDAIKPVGWTNWHDTDQYKNARYAEYQNTGAGANSKARVDWAHIITSSTEADQYNTLNVLKTTYEKDASVDNWNPGDIIQKINDIQSND